MFCCARGGEHLRLADFTEVGERGTLGTDTRDLRWFKGQLDLLPFDDVRILLADDVEHTCQ